MYLVSFQDLSPRLPHSEANLTLPVYFHVPPPIQLTAMPQSGILGQLVLFDFGTFHIVRGLTMYVLNDQEARLLQISQSTRPKKPQKR